MMIARNLKKPFSGSKWSQRNRKRTMISLGETYVSWIPSKPLIMILINFLIPGEPIALKGIMIGVVLAFLSQSCGSYVFITYASTIFEKSGTNFSSEISSIVLAIVQIAGTLSAARFVETQGRKLLLIISLTGCTLGLTSMAVYLYCDSLGFDISMFTWVPVTSLGLVIFISSAGIVPLSLICLVELLPSKVRSFGLTVATTSMSFFAFCVVMTFPILMEIINMHGCMLIFAITCALGVVFLIFLVDETKGKTLDLLNVEKSDPVDANV